MIVINDLFYKIDNTEIITDLNLTINDGEQIAIVGPSGCGKTTLLKLLLNLIEPTNGTITNDASSTGYMPQKDLLLPWLTIGENISLPKEIAGNNLTEEEIVQILKEFQVDAHPQNYPHELSGGMQSRINLIRALMMSNEVIFLDEPFAKLDYLTHLSITNWYGKIIKEKNLTSVLVTHNIDEAIKLADRIIVLSAKPAKIIDEYCVASYDKDDLKAKVIDSLTIT